MGIWSVRIYTRVPTSTYGDRRCLSVYSRMNDKKAQTTDYA